MGKFNVARLIQRLAGDPATEVRCQYADCQSAYALDATEQDGDGQDVTAILCVNGDSRPVCAACHRQFLSHLKAAPYADYLVREHGFALGSMPLALPNSRRDGAGANALPRPPTSRSAGPDVLPRPPPRMRSVVALPAQSPVTERHRQAPPQRSTMGCDRGAPLSAPMPALPRHVSSGFDGNPSASDHHEGYAPVQGGPGQEIVSCLVPRGGEPTYFVGTMPTQPSNRYGAKAWGEHKAAKARGFRGRHEAVALGDEQGRRSVCISSDHDGTMVFLRHQVQERVAVSRFGVSGEPSPVSTDEIIPVAVDRSVTGSGGVLPAERLAEYLARALLRALKNDPGQAKELWNAIRALDTPPGTGLDVLAELWNAAIDSARPFEP